MLASQPFILNQTGESTTKTTWSSDFKIQNSKEKGKEKIQQTCKGSPKDRFPSSAILLGEVTSLDHKALDNPVKW
jgi:hypothetical protein